MTQILVSGYWSTAFSHDVLYYSTNIAFYFLSLGLGSILSQVWARPDTKQIFRLTVYLSIWLSVSIILVKFGIRTFGNVVAIPIVIVTVAGILSGQIIPLTLQVCRNNQRMSLSKLFFVDYGAAILFTLLFTFWLLIPFGYGKTSLYVGLLSIAAILALGMSQKLWQWKNFLPFGACCLFLILLEDRTLPKNVAPRHIASDKKPKARVLHSEQSHYQKIVLTEEKGSNPFFPDSAEHVLYLDGFLQFNSLYEQAYHACIANIPMAAAEHVGHPARRALILGGGDGLAARNLLSIPKMQEIVLVELDPAIIRLAKTKKEIRRYNRDSLFHRKVKTIIADAFLWVRKSHKKFDIIVIDFPAPKNITLARLFTAEFYTQVFRLLNPNGFIAIQAGPIFAADDDSKSTLSRVTTSIEKSIRAIGKQAYPYFSGQDKEAFILATDSKQFDMDRFSSKIGIYEKKDAFHFCIYRPHWNRYPVEINTLNTLVLADYMLDWFKKMSGPFFKYQGSYATFLPD